MAMKARWRANALPRLPFFCRFSAALLPRFCRRGGRIRAKTA